MSSHAVYWLLPPAGIVILGNVLISIPIVLNGMIGANLRIPFPVAARASMGYWFSLFAVLSRCVLAFFALDIAARVDASPL